MVKPIRSIAILTNIRWHDRGREASDLPQILDVSGPLRHLRECDFGWSTRDVPTMDGARPSQALAFVRVGTASVHTAGTDTLIWYGAPHP